MIHARPSTTTHTLETGQVGDINDRLSSRPSVTAAELTMTGAPVLGHKAATLSGESLSGSAVLVRLSWEGSPEYPYIHGHFAERSSAHSATVGAVAVELHTPALRLLSHQLHLHHVWGVGSLDS